MRFRKSIRITKGVKLNVSKSGASLTVGGKGLSLNLGGKGAFLNWSIPGTGLYDRVRLDTLAGKALDALGLGGGMQAASAGKKAGPTQEELEAQAEGESFVHVQELAADVAPESAAAQTPQACEDAIEAWLSGLQSPVPFFVQTQVTGRTAYLDLDLPEIEDIPGRKLVMLASGEVKWKDKSQKERRSDYCTCVFGLGEFVASHALGVAPSLEKAVVSAYTQRRNEKTGALEDVYIYSVVFVRPAFYRGYQSEDPYAFCRKLESRLYRLASGELKRITPFEPEEMA